MAWLRCGSGIVWIEESSSWYCTGVGGGGGSWCRDEVDDLKGKRKAADDCDNDSDDWSWSSDGEEYCEADREREVPDSSAGSNRNVNGGTVITSHHRSSCPIVILDDSTDEEEDRMIISVPCAHPSAATTTDIPPRYSVPPLCLPRTDEYHSTHPAPHLNTTTPITTSHSSTASSSCYIDLLDTDLLSAIFSRIDAGTDEVFRTVPFVCRSWRDACRVDTVDLTGYRHREKSQLQVDVAVRSVAWRCRHHVRRVMVPSLSHEALDYVLWIIPCLKVLKIPYSPAPDAVFLAHAHRLRHLTDVNLSYCTNVTARGIAALGRSCPCLVRLVRRLNSPLDPAGAHADGLDDSEPMAIAETMPALEDLVLEDVRVSVEGVRAVVERCPSLRYFDLTGCLGLREEDGFWSRMRDVTVGGLVPTGGFRERPVVMNKERYYLYPVE